MNSKKKIIDTLRSADKASVEKLMADEAKKNELFAKAMERANNGTESGFADSVSGVEQYERKISISHIASIAAAAVLIAGGVLGGMHLMKSNSFNNHGSESDYTTEATVNTTQTTETTTAEPSTTAVTTTVIAVLPVEVPVTTEAHDDVPEMLSGKYLLDKACNATHYYDKFSADFTYFSPVYHYHISEETISGKVKIDNTTMTGEAESITYNSSGEPDYKSYEFFLNNISVQTTSDYGSDNFSWCDINSIEKIYNEYTLPDRVRLANYPGTLFTDFDNSLTYTLPDGTVIQQIKSISPCTMTDERIENGRLIGSITISYEQLFEGNYEKITVNADIDAETGVCLAFERYSEGELIGSFKVTNYKFDDEAEAPMTAKEVRQFLDENGCKAEEFSEYQVENIG